MIAVGIDTNILLRLIVDDDDEQRRIVLDFGARLNREYRGLITLVALLEVDWALRSQFGFSRRNAVDAIRRLTRIRGVDVESHDTVVRSLLHVEDRGADFADALIAERSRELGCARTMTLDVRATKRIPLMEQLG